jgi:sulfide:quinone oxidoreductase
LQSRTQIDPAPFPAKSLTMADNAHHRVLIVGGGTAGITVATNLKRRAPAGTDIAILEPSPSHYYQPCFTLVGAGAYALDSTRRPTESLVPSGVRLIRAAAEKFDPENNQVSLRDGSTISYDYLVVCTGVKLDWDKVEGLAETLGRKGVCSNYAPEQANYTRECLQSLKPGSRAIFTQPPLPFKCPGAPQKIADLSTDHLRRKNMLKDCNLQFFTHAPAIFGVPSFARDLVKIAARYGLACSVQLAADFLPGVDAAFDMAG